MENKINKNLNQSVLYGKYLGLTPPKVTPEIFALGIISTHHHEHSFPTFSPDGREVYWSLWRRPDEGLPQVIMFMKQEEDQWSNPQIAPFSGRYSDGGPFITCDGLKLFFYSKRPITSEEEKAGSNNIWFVEKTKGGWSAPKNLGVPINDSKLQAAPSLSRENNLYFLGFLDGVEGNMGIYRSMFRKGKYKEPELLDKTINSKYHDWTPFIDPDEKYLIFSSNRPGSYGAFDLYISFRSDSGIWGEPENMGKLINTKEYSERFPGISPDGKYLFFARGSDIYWVEARTLKHFK